MPITETLWAFLFCPPGHGGSDVEGEQDGAPQEAEERQGQPTELQERETPQAEQPDYKELLNRRGASIAELKAQLAEVAKSKESVDAIATEIERVRTEASEEKMAYELIRRPTPRGSPVIASERASRSASRGSPLPVDASQVDKGS